MNIRPSAAIRNMQMEAKRQNRFDVVLLDYRATANEKEFVLWLMSFRNRVILIELEDIRNELCVALQQYIKGNEEHEICLD